MDIDRDTVVEIVISLAAVSLFITALVTIGTTYNDAGFSTDGAFALIGTIVVFVLLMAGVGLWLAYSRN